MKTYTKVFFAVAVAMVMCICPLAVAADNSDAYDVKTGEAGITAKADNWNETQVNGFFSPDYIESEARSVLIRVVDNSSKFEISDAKITSLSFERGYGNEVKDDRTISYEGFVSDYTISFKATAKADASKNLNQIKPLDEAIKAIGTPALTTGDVLEITAKVKSTSSTKITELFTKRDSGDFVVTENDRRDAQTLKMEISAKYTKAGSASGVSFTYNVEFDYSASIENEYDFNGVDISKVTSSTYVFPDPSVSGGFDYRMECTVGDKSESVSGIQSVDSITDSEIIQYLMYGFGGYTNVKKATVYDHDLKVTTYALVDATADERLLTDCSLTTDAAVNEYLKANNGATTTSFSDAKSICNDNYSAVPDVTQLLNVVLVGVIAVMGVIILVLIIVLIIVAVKKKKR